MKLLFNKISSTKIQTFLKILIMIFLFLYVFSIASFSERNFQKFTILNYGYYLIYVSMAAVLLLVIVYIFLFKQSLKINPFYIFVPVFVVYAFIGTLFYTKLFKEWISLVLLCISFFGFVYSFRIIKNKYLIISLISIALFLFTTFFLLYYVKDIFKFKLFFSGELRLGSDFDNQNGVAAQAVISFGLSAYLFVKLKNKIKFLFLISVITSAWVGLSTGSRTFIVTAYLIAVLLFSNLFARHKVIYFLSVTVITFVVFFVFNSIFDNRLLKALQTIIGDSAKSDNSTLSRELYFDYGLVLGSRNIIIGYGARGFGVVSGIGTYAHNNYAEVLCDFGVVGLILFYLPLVVFLFRSTKIKKIDKLFITTFAIYYFLTSFTTVIYYKKMYFLMLALMFFLVFDEPFSLANKPLVSKLKSVLFTCDSMGGGGAERVIACLANQMSMQHIKVIIVGVADTTNDSFYELSKDVGYENLADGRNAKPPFIKRLFRLRKLITDYNPDIVISFLPNANVYTWISLFGTNIPYIVSERNNPRIDPKNRIRRFLKLLSFRFANGVVFQTNEAKNFYPLSIQNKSRIIKNPLSVRADIKKMHRFQTRNNVILAVGRLTEQKNYKCMLDAFKIFSKKVNQPHLLKIYGNGPLEKELKDYCIQLDLNDSVVFAGSDRNWQEKEFNDCMYLLSSNYEGMPNSLAEAMALGIPSISTDCPSGGSKELIQDGFNGYLVPINDPRALAEKMILLANNPSNEFASRNEKMMEEYSVLKITNIWINFIEGLTKEVYE